MIKSLLALFLFATAVFAQGAYIGLPTYNQSVSPGSDLTVQVQLPDTLTGSEQVAVVIGLQSCPDHPCGSPSGDMGTILYNGPFNPQRYETSLPPYENFTMQVPSSVPIGGALIGVAHFSLVAVGLWPFLEVLNQTITIV